MLGKNKVKKEIDIFKEEQHAKIKKHGSHKNYLFV